MPEKVTREEKIVELAIMKARETLEALRDGEDTKLDIVKLKRPKAEKADKIKNQTQKKQGYGLAGDEFNGEVKKMSEREKDRMWWKKQQDVVHKNDAVIRELERKNKDKMTPEMEATIKEMKAKTEAMYKALTLLKSKKYKMPNNDEEKKAEDPRDVSFSPEEQESADVRFKEIGDAIDHYSKMTGSNPSINDLGKIESAQKKLLEELNKMTTHYGRS